MAESNNEEIEAINNLIAGSVAIKRVTVDDLNKLTLTGKYYTIGDDSIKNKPEDGLYNNYITVMDVPYNNIVQTFTNLVSGKAYVRTKYGERPWSAWEPMCIKNELKEAKDRIGVLEDKAAKLDSKLYNGVVVATYSFNLHTLWDSIPFIGAFSTIDFGRVSQSNPSRIILAWDEEPIKKSIYVPEGCHLEMTGDITLNSEGDGTFYLYSDTNGSVTGVVSFSGGLLRVCTKRVTAYSLQTLYIKWVSGSGNVWMQQNKDTNEMYLGEKLPANCVITYYVVRNK